MKQNNEKRLIFDLHCDTIWKISEAQRRGESIFLKKSNLQVDEEKLIKGNYFAQCFAVYIPNEYPDPYARCLHDIDIYDRQIKQSRVLAPVYDFADFQKNEKNGKISAILTMEDGCPIGEDFDKLYTLHRKGVRMICLLHNLVNPIGNPNFGGYFADGSPDRSVANTATGLTDFGRALVQEMNKLGIVIDVSHLSDKGFYEVVQLSEKPIMASHSNARTVCCDIRNLTDDMLIKLAENGGVAGINYANHFMSNDAEYGRNTVKCALLHMRHIKKKIGVDHIALGSDFDGINPDIEISDASKTGRLIVALEKEGFSTDEIEKITYRNALRVFKANMLL